jgi:hypothetical protein
LPRVERTGGQQRRFETIRRCAARSALLLERAPRRDVAVVIQLGEDDLVALPSSRPMARAT